MLWVLLEFSLARVYQRAMSWRSSDIEWKIRIIFSKSDENIY